jgi:S-methylmethionine-dependent homocysteine/selenocysteine methylase
MHSAGRELERRLAAGPIVLDGATGTELTRRGVDTTLPLWSAAALRTHPQAVESIHRDYAEAGAQIIVANTFRTNPRTLRRAGCAADGPELNRLAIAIARRAIAECTVRRRVWVAGSVAPVEDCYSPQLVPDEPTLLDEHRRMVAWLRDAQPDLIWIETMNTVREARAAAGAAFDAGLPLVVSFVVREDGNLLSGEPLEAAVDAVEPFAPLAIGLNCIPPEGITRNLPRLRQATRRPLAAYAHIGNPEPICGWSFSQSVPPQRYAEHAQRWRATGATIIGGCCGTTPAHIAALAEQVRTDAAR